MGANEYLSPAERAKKFSSGTFTASQTGAKDEAARHFENQMKMNANADANGKQTDFENHVAGLTGNLGETPKKGKK